MSDSRFKFVIHWWVFVSPRVKEVSFLLQRCAYHVGGRSLLGNQVYSLQLARSLMERLRVHYQLRGRSVRLMLLSQYNVLFGGTLNFNLLLVLA